MTETLEREAKLVGTGTFAVERRGEIVGPYTILPAARRRRLHTVYYDVPALRLMQWGASLHYRIGQGWTLKLADDESRGPEFRVEYAFAGSGDVIPAGALDAASAFLRGEVPRRIAELRTIRTSRTVVSPGGAPVAVILQDDVRVIHANAVVKNFRQIEVVLCQSTPDAMQKELHADVIAAGAGRTFGVAQVALAIGRSPPPEVAIPEMDRRARLGTMVRSILAQGVDAIVRIDAPLRVAPDADVVHVARVRVRRLLSTLRALRPVIDRRRTRAIEIGLSWFDSVLADARDSDVFLSNMADRLTHTPTASPGAERVIDEAREHRSRAYSKLLETLRNPRYYVLIEWLIATPESVRAHKPKRAARAVVPQLMRRLWKRARRAARCAREQRSDVALHRLRIAMKRLRYAAEAFAPVAGRDALNFAKRVGVVQTQLGRHHDAVEAERRLSCGPSGGFYLVAGAHAAARKAARHWTSSWRRIKRSRWRRHKWYRDGS